MKTRSLVGLLGPKFGNEEQREPKGKKTKKKRRRGLRCRFHKDSEMH